MARPKKTDPTTDPQPEATVPGLPPSLIKGLYEMNFTKPSKIQAISLPKIWANRNLLAQSHNGTGKTACFVLGMLRIADARVKKPQALCICPTRELAKQIAEETHKMGKFMLQESGMTVKCILKEEKYDKGGAKMPDQIVIGTPGKIWTLISLRVLETAAIKVFVLDEADEMLTAGHGDNTKRIHKVLPRQLQTLFFSATWKDETVKFANSLKGSGPSAQVTIKRKHIFNDQVKQYYLECDGFKEKEERLG